MVEKVLYHVQNATRVSFGTILALLRALWKQSLMFAVVAKFLFKFNEFGQGRVVPTAIPHEDSYGNISMHS